MCFCFSPPSCHASIYVRLSIYIWIIHCLREPVEKLIRMRFVFPRIKQLFVFYLMVRLVIDWSFSVKFKSFVLLFCCCRFLHSIVAQMSRYQFNESNDLENEYYFFCLKWSAITYNLNIRMLQCSLFITLTL